MTNRSITEQARVTDLDRHEAHTIISENFDRDDMGRLREAIATALRARTAAHITSAPPPETVIYNIAQRDPHYRKWLIEQLTALGDEQDKEPLREVRFTSLTECVEVVKNTLSHINFGSAEYLRNEIISALQSLETKPAVSEPRLRSICTAKLRVGERVYSLKTATICELLDDTRVIIKETPESLVEQLARAAATPASPEAEQPKSAEAIVRFCESTTFPFNEKVAYVQQALWLLESAATPASPKLCNICLAAGRVYCPPEHAAYYAPEHKQYCSVQTCKICYQQSPRVCMKCGHGGTPVGEQCTFGYVSPDHIGCGCKCEFSES